MATPGRSAKKQVCRAGECRIKSTPPIIYLSISNDAKDKNRKMQHGFMPVLCWKIILPSYKNILEDKAGFRQDDLIAMKDSKMFLQDGLVILQDALPVLQDAPKAVKGDQRILRDAEFLWQDALKCLQDGFWNSLYGVKTSPACNYGRHMPGLRQRRVPGLFTGMQTGKLNVSIYSILSLPVARSPVAVS